MSLSVTIVTPHRKVVHKLSVDELIMPSEAGEVTILPGHTHFLTALGVGVIRTLSQDERIHFLVSYGFAEVRDDQVLILGEDIEPASQIDLERAQKAKAEVEEKILNKVLGEIEYANYLKRLQAEQKRIEVAKQSIGPSSKKKK